MLTIAITIIIWLASIPAMAATYWVAPTGAAAWGSCSGSTPLTGGNACSPATAFANAVAGDVVYFRGGTYTSPQRNTGDSYTSYYMPSHSGTVDSWITFQAYTGETPVFDGTSGGTADLYGTNGYIGCKVMGVSGKEYIILDGFTITCDGGTKMGGMTVGSSGGGNTPGPYLTNYVIIRNCTINGGTTVNTGTDNADGIRLNSVGHATIKNNVIYNFLQSTNVANTAATKAYHTAYTVYEGNYIYNSSTGIYDKSDGWYNIYRYNFIRNVYEAIHIPTNSYRQLYGQVYHNIIVNSGGNGILITSETSAVPYISTDWEVHHNTIYSATAATGHPIVIVWQGNTPLAMTGYSVHNNIVAQAGLAYYGSNVRIQVDLTAGFVETGLGLDYNNYGANGEVVFRDAGAWYDYTTLAALKAAAAYNLASGSHDQHSIAAAPVFTNASGNYLYPSDFLLASGSPGENAGSDGNDMGANVSLVWYPTIAVTWWRVAQDPVTRISTVDPVARAAQSSRPAKSF